MMPKIHDGDVIVLTRRDGPDGPGARIPAVIHGPVRSFKDDEGKTRWEVETNDPQHPAVGFDPETATFRLE